MHGIYFNNPIKILHRLKEAGFTEKQSEAWVEVFSDHLEHGLVTKKDLKAELKDLRSEIKELELRMTIKTAVIVASIVGFFSLLEKFF
jgi:hypothetical protein